MSYNITDNVEHNETHCQGQAFMVFIGLSDFFSVIVGQPLIAKLLWTAIHSKRVDVLNINLAFYHNFQYLLTVIHSFMVISKARQHIQIMMFLFVYVLIGGPMMLFFICLERYIAVVHPTFYPLLRTYRCREACALSVWLLSLPTAVVKATSLDVNPQHVQRSSKEDSADNMSYNITDNVEHNETHCQGQAFMVFIGLNDFFSVIVGQPLIAKLLWTAIHSKRVDVLNINLAFYHNFQYLLTVIHSFMVISKARQHIQMMMFLYVYVLIGGPMMLFFICLERYIAVVYPTVYPLLRTYRCREACALSVWLVSLPTAVVKATSLDVNRLMKITVMTQCRCAFCL
ncbi:hypothetical protein NHX12_029931 [Muraenolepis orangiensis]|uniref:G-protein coupled receptors family 1 profile domain-containing protein n=1 Tax=Muraenolepis orangiensis TaxID=630683 RepID=A0A9Q0IIY4_9TELE|nr:hypothetical protein NHX12_029931 [Muraenolepis orangiensis]